MPRRIYTYPATMGWNFWNAISSIGAFVIAAGVLIFLYNVWYTSRLDAPVPEDPWDARTLEWITPNPTPEYNFIEVPEVESQDEFWHRKYGENDEHKIVRLKEASEVMQRRATKDDHIHMPSPSYWPIVAAFGLPIIGYGQIYRLWAISIVGLLVVLFGLYAWSLEPSTAPHEPDDPEIEEPHELGAAPEVAAVGAGGGGASEALPAAGESTISDAADDDGTGR
jgi:cytochrome c oxidase subunit 1